MRTWTALSLVMLACGPHPASRPRLQVSPEDASLSSELVLGGSVVQRLAPPDEAELVLFFGAEEQGSLEPCGCEGDPRGGLGRVASYLAAAREELGQTPSLYVDGGAWLDDGRGLGGQALPEAAVRNRWMIRGLQSLEVDALNVAVSDAWALEAMGTAPSVPLVSANVSGPGVQVARSFELGVRVAVTGLTVPGPAFLQPEGYALAPPREIRDTFIDLREAHELVVLLSYGAADEARRLARQGLVDVVIDTERHRGSFPPARVGDAVWVRSHEGTARLGELRLRREASRWSAHERKVELDEQVPVSEPIRSYTRRARRETAAAQRETLGRVVR